MACAPRVRGVAGIPGRGYSLEWKVDFSLLEVGANVYYNASMPDTQMNINIAVGDVDEPETAVGCCGLRHEQWLSGDGGRGKTCPFDFGLLWMMQSSWAEAHAGRGGH